MAAFHWSVLALLGVAVGIYPRTESPAKKAMDEYCKLECKGWRKEIS
ncbi:hypothetical protein [Hydrogenispora ethanolica]|jgi:hypothetical protein|nr:hypothetical protein [Hydrogenispora ethanolica]